MTPVKLEKARWQLSIYAFFFELMNRKAKIDKLFVIRLRNKMKKDGSFDHIKEIIETATDCGFDCVNAVPDTAVGTCTIVGPTEDEFIEVAAKAIDSRESDNIGEGDAQETVMTAASVQLK